VTFHSRNTIGQTLDAFRPAYDAGYASCIVVDNASSDDTAGYITEHYPWVKLVCVSKNLGFGRGCNLGFESVETPYVLFLNPDASIRLDALEVLVCFMNSQPKVGITGPATEIKDWGYQPAGMMLTPARLIRAALGAKVMHEQERVIEPGSVPFQTSWICGAIFMIRSSLFAELGGFDPRFFLYFEETDLCLRTARKGMEIWAVGEATSVHLCGASARLSGEELTGDLVAPFIGKYFYPSRLYYLVKNFGWIRAVTAELVSGVMDWLRWHRKAFLNRGDGLTLKRPERPFMRLPDRTS
jgi:GT2 family glycosyltransferase